jgi:hypothetical protein
VGCQGVFITGSGKLITETFNYADFTNIEAHNGFQVEVNKANTFRVEITADDNVQEYLKVAKSGNTLSIGLRGVISLSSVQLKAEITMPELHGLDLSGGARANTKGFSSSHNFLVGLSGGSRIEGDIKAADAKFDLSGGSQVTLSGSANNLHISGSGGSQLDLESFSVSSANINLSGGSRATINMDGTLSADLSGGSKVIYVGEASLGDIDLSGGSTINRK